VGEVAVTEVLGRPVGRRWGRSRARAKNLTLATPGLLVVSRSARVWLPAVICPVGGYSVTEVSAIGPIIVGRRRTAGLRRPLGRERVVAGLEFQSGGKARREVVRADARCPRLSSPS